jgi:ABC-type multidrug transport system fused ATPase/permease subunit
MIERESPQEVVDWIIPTNWPATGELLVKNLTARYSPDGPDVLHGISFHIRSGERVGIGASLVILIPNDNLYFHTASVGRTGSGKTSLALSLLRCIYTDGEVLYDGRSTSTMDVDTLRRAMAIIPQVVRHSFV